MSLKGELHAKYTLLLFERALKMLTNDTCINKSAKPFSRYEAINFKFPRKKYRFLSMPAYRMVNNGIRDITVDHFIMTKKQSAISPLFRTLEL